MKFSIQKSKNDNRGFVALFAVLISAIILSIVVGISNIAYKEAILSSSAREGQYAFFAADSGAECALYADIKQAKFVDLAAGNTTPISFDCGGSPVGSQSWGAEPSFNFEFQTSDGSKDYCSKVNVQKNYVALDGLNYTKIISKGYNLSCADLLTPNDRSVERVIRVTY